MVCSRPRGAGRHAVTAFRGIRGQLGDSRATTPIKGLTMCGIVAYVGRKAAQPLLVEGLKRLEYRGYDSAGVAVIDDAGRLHVRRAVGRISVLEDSLTGAR